ncbi:SRPBCC domain-containing protein [Danxiaibacter flavus]|uniref:SRPBCC domain-containing protein n=1 Tax=Danxiaibacter flavus TaxID=3049108 RepID=A0ABV3ZHN7_9BACT|nr:SRPBCC domain-containing protein [Chitinophagaceae bacterium DXS]
MEHEPLVVERTYNATAETVWDAITNSAKMKKWYFDISAFKPEPGFEFEFTAGSDKKMYKHLCKVVDVDPLKKLSYSWRYEGYPGSSVVTFELMPTGHETVVRLTHTGLETFPQDSPDFALASFTEGWNYILGKGLKEFVES